MSAIEGQSFVALRQRAEKILSERVGKANPARDADLIRHFHELEVNQVELDLQNEELRHAHRELEDSRNQYFDLYDSAPVGFITLTHKGLVARANRAAKELLAPLGRIQIPIGFSQWIHPQDHNPYHFCLKKAAESGGRHTCEVRIVGNGKDFLYVRIEVVAGLDEAGKPTEWRLAISDITSQKKSEAALVKSEQMYRKLARELETERLRLEQKVSERTRELENNYEKLSRANAQLQVRAGQLRRLASDLTMTEQRERKRLSKLFHDGLQQHLATAKMRIGYFADKLRNPDRKGEAHDIEAILGESIQISRSLSVELSPPVLQEGRLTDGLEWLARWMRAKYHFNVELSFNHQVELPEDVVILVFESVRELLFNAVKHAKVSWAKVTLRQEGPSETRIIVSDDGAGFNPSLLNSPEAATEGLGLFSIGERIDSIGGRFEIDSAPGKGCRFTIIVPASVKHPAAVADKISSNIAGSRKHSHKVKKIRVLLADDHSLFRDGIGRILNQEPDIEVVGYARDGLEAIELARKLMPEIILMDIGMPGMDGIEATRNICRESPAIRIIGLSMYADEQRNRAMLAAGAVDYRSKDCTPGKLVSAIRTCLI